MNGEAFEPVRDRRAGRAPRLVVGPEHEVVDEELRAPSEEVFERGAPLIGLESILLVDPDPRQRLASPRQFVAAPRQLLLLLEQPEPRGQPLFTCPDHVSRHRSSLPWVSLVEWPMPTASTVTTAPAHSTMAVRNVGERIVQSTMTVAFSLRHTGLWS